MERLETKNLYLRQLSLGDITREYIDALNDEEVVRLTEARHRKWDEESVRRYVTESNTEGVSQLLGIFLSESGKHIGNARLSNFSTHHKRVELGIMIFDKTQWSKGYGTETLLAVADYVFKRLKLHKICADYYSINSGAARYLEKTGFQIEGVFKEHFLLNGEYIDSVRVAKFSQLEDQADE